MDVENTVTGEVPWEGESGDLRESREEGGRDKLAEAHDHPVLLKTNSWASVRPAGFDVLSLALFPSPCPQGSLENK